MTTMGTIEFTRCSAVVLYDRKSGDIVHVHECWTERGARHPSKKTLTDEAFQYAREDRPKLKRRAVAALHTDPSDLNVSAGELLRVDVRRKRLERFAAPAQKLQRIQERGGVVR